MLCVFSADTTAAGHAPSEVGTAAAASAAGSRQHGFSAGHIRQQMKLSNCGPERLKATQEIVDLGSQKVGGPAEDQVRQVQARFEELLKQNNTPICLGGDHLIKAGGIRASLKHSSRLGVIYLDAHPDMRIDKRIRYDTILHDAFDAGLAPHRCVLVGLRQSTEEEVKGIRHYGPRIVFGSQFAEEWPAVIGKRISGWLAECDRVYVSIDPDGLNPAEAGAVEQQYPGGPTVDQFIVLLREAIRAASLIAADVSEHVPELDDRRSTAIGLAKIVTEISAI